MTRRQKRRNRPGGGGLGKAQSGGLQVDHTLHTLVRNFLALPEGSAVILPDGRTAVSEEAHLYLSAIQARVGAGPEGQARFDAALAAVRRPRGCM